MNKKRLIPIILIVAAILLLLYYMTGDENVSLRIVKGDEEIVLEGEFIYQLEEAISFPAVVRSSGKKPVETEYKGIELVKLFEAAGIDIWDVERITLNATDGYRIILAVDEIYEPNNVYLTYERDGQLMKSKKKGGNGPFQLVIRHDPFSQRWIKHVEEIILE